MRTIAFCIFVCTFAVKLLAQSEDDPRRGSSEFTLRSEELSREYRIRVSVGSTALSRPVPVVFVLDGQWGFDLANAVYGGLRQDGFVSDALIVGVCIQGTDDERRAIRSQDFAPTTSSGSGKDELFRRFLLDSIVQEIEKRFQCDNHNRTLIGWSMGGMFAVETMLTSPDAFRNYVAISPALFWDKAHASKRLKSSDFIKPNRPLSMLVTVGEFEPPLFQSPIWEFAKDLENLKFSDLDFQVRKIEKERHFSSRAIAYGLALKKVLSPRIVDVSVGAMKAVCGTFRPTDKQWEWWGEVEIGLTDGQLWAERKFAGFEGRDALIPISDNTFVGTRYGSQFKVMQDSDKMFIEMKWEEFPTIKISAAGK